MIQIVIDISENTYNLITRGDENRDFVYKSDLMHAIKNGTPLPEGHGDLIDRGELEADAEWNDRYESYTAFSSGQIVNAPAIIKADKEGD